MPKNKKEQIKYDSPVILTFALLCLAALIINTVTKGWANINLFSVYNSSYSDPLTYVRLFLHVIGHANYEHFLSNICLLLVVGPYAENYYGSIGLLLCILITAIVSGIIHFIFFPGIALLGASGIVFMLIFLSSITGIKKGIIPLTSILVAVLYLGKEVYSLFFIEDNISQITHIIGGICGILCGSFLLKKD